MRSGKRGAVGVAVVLLWAGGSLGRPGAGWAQAPTASPQIEPGPHTAKVYHLGIDHAERWVVTVSDDQAARVWDLGAGQLVGILRPPIGPDEEGRLYAVAISPDGQRVVVGGFT